MREFHIGVNVGMPPAVRNPLVSTDDPLGMVHDVGSAGDYRGGSIP
jgi:hypothetical protein